MKSILNNTINFDLQKAGIMNFFNHKTKEIYPNYFMFSYFKDNIGYIMNDTINQILIGVDFGEFKKSKEVVDIIENLTKSKLKYILTTHSHWDHSGGNEEWKIYKQNEITIISGETPTDLVPNTDIFLIDNKEIDFGNIKVKCLHTPGHIKSHVCYYVQDLEINKQNFVFTGDTLFSSGCGRVFTCTHEEMFSSLNRLKALPLNTMIFCGHEYTKKNLEFSLSLDKDNKNIKDKIEQNERILEEYSFSVGSTLEDELLYNPFLRCEEEYFKNKFEENEDVEIFKIIRLLKDKF